MRKVASTIYFRGDVSCQTKTLLNSSINSSLSKCKTREHFKKIISICVSLSKRYRPLTFYIYTVLIHNLVLFWSLCHVTAVFMKERDTTNDSISRCLPVPVHLNFIPLLRGKLIFNRKKRKGCKKKTPGINLGSGKSCLHWNFLIRYLKRRFSKLFIPYMLTYIKNNCMICFVIPCFLYISLLKLMIESW